MNRIAWHIPACLPNCGKKYDVTIVSKFKIRSLLDTIYIGSLASARLHIPQTGASEQPTTMDSLSFCVYIWDAIKLANQKTSWNSCSIFMYIYIYTILYVKLACGIFSYFGNKFIISFYIGNEFIKHYIILANFDFLCQFMHSES